MGTLRTVMIAGAAGLASGLFPAPPAHAQAGAAAPAALAFEEVGGFPLSASDLAFDGEGALWAVSGVDVWRLAPGASTWEEVATISAARHVLPLGPDTLLINGIRRSLNGGQTWTRVFDDGDELFEAPTSGILLAGSVLSALGLGLAYSHDRGATWHEAGIDAGPSVPYARAFGELPPGHAHAGRLVAGCWGGLSYSDDRGVTWARSGLWQDGGRYHARSVAVGVDGRVYGALYESGVEGLQVAVSTDGGATYAPPYRFGIYVGIGVRVFAVPGGADPAVGVVLVVEYDGSVWRSDDGAASFLRVGRIPFTYEDGHLRDAAVGPDGRLYVAGGVAGTQDEWVFRTVEPVVSATVGVTAAPAADPVVVGASGGAFSFTVTLTNPTGEVQAFEAWSEATGPAAVSPVIGPVAVTLPAGASVVRTLVQQVPGAAPPGTYTYTVSVGAFGEAVLSSASFEVVKQRASEGAGGGADGWAVSGWEEASAVAPEEAASLVVVPNPFRGEAAVTLTLGAASEATVALYDVLGRRVALLHEGALEAGTHAFRLDGRGLPAGVYVVRAMVGDGGRGAPRAATARVTVLR